MKRKVLIVAMPFSIHIVRWINLFKSSEWEIHFFSSYPYHGPHPEMEGVVFHDHFFCRWRDSGKNCFRDFSDRSVRIPSASVAKWVGKAYRFFGFQKSQVHYLRTLIDCLQPDLIHSLESQNGGYLVSDVFGTLIRKPTWIHSTMGIDLDYFMHFPKHRQRLIDMFSKIDIYVAEGERDLRIAGGLGFRGMEQIFPSVGGGYIIENFTSKVSKNTSERKKILVKGYQDSVRRGLVAIRAIANCRDVLDGYEIVAIACSPVVVDYIQYLRSREGIDITIANDSGYDEWLCLLAEARISITNNLSDGLPSLLFESMLLGVFPIQSESVSSDEWIENGVTGMYTKPEDSGSIERAIREAVGNDRLVDLAAGSNFRKVAASLAYDRRRTEGLELYDKAAGMMR